MTHEQPKAAARLRGCENDPANQGDAVVSGNLDPLGRKTEPGRWGKEMSLLAREVNQAGFGQT
jgi:hypothetical protein